MLKNLFKFIFIFFVSICLIGCSSKDKNDEIQEVESVVPGVYLGEKYSEESMYNPKLTLTENNEFEFNISVGTTYSGQYHIDDGKVILTITEDKSYTFKQKGNDLVIQEEIPMNINKGCKFKLWGTIPK